MQTSAISAISFGRFSESALPATVRLSGPVNPLSEPPMSSVSSEIFRDVRVFVPSVIRVATAAESPGISFGSNFEPAAKLMPRGHQGKPPILDQNHFEPIWQLSPFNGR